MSFGHDLRLFVADANTAAPLRAKDPLEAMARGPAAPPVPCVDAADAEMLAAIAQARETWPQFLMRRLAEAQEQEKAGKEGAGKVSPKKENAGKEAAKRPPQREKGC